MDKRALWPSLVTGTLLAGGCAPPVVPAMQELPKQITVADTAFDPDRLGVTPHLQSYTEKRGFPEYVLGPGDLLGITLREVELTTELVAVRPDSNISFNLVENTRAGGLTLRELDKALTREVALFLKEPKIDIQIAEYNSKKVSLLGAVQSIPMAEQQTGQGQYPLKGKSRVLDMILMAGGTTQDAQLNKVQLNRGGRSYTLNLQRSLSTGDQSHNVILQGDDIIVVPGASQLNKKVIVLGQVRSPDVYLFPEDASLMDAISKAQGVLPTALTEDIRVIRNTSEGPKMFSVDFNRITTDLDLRQNIPLNNNDIVFVPKKD